MNRTRPILFLLFACTAAAAARMPLKHVIGENVAQFAEKEGIDLKACRARKLHAWTCKALISAEQGNRVTVGKDGEWSAVLDGGKLISYDDDLKNSSGAERATTSRPDSTK